MTDWEAKYNEQVAETNRLREELSRTAASTVEPVADKPGPLGWPYSTANARANNIIWRLCQGVAPQAIYDALDADGLMIVEKPSAPTTSPEPREDNRWIAEAQSTLDHLSRFLQKTGAPHRVDWKEWIDSADKHLGLKWPSEVASPEPDAVRKPEIRLEGNWIVDHDSRLSIAKFELYNGTREELQAIIDRANAALSAPVAGTWPSREVIAQIINPQAFDEKYSMPRGRMREQRYALERADTIRSLARNDRGRAS